MQTCVCENPCSGITEVTTILNIAAQASFGYQPVRHLLHNFLPELEGLTIAHPGRSKDSLYLVNKGSMVHLCQCSPSPENTYSMITSWNCEVRHRLASKSTTTKSFNISVYFVLDLQLYICSSLCAHVVFVIKIFECLCAYAPLSKCV